MSSDLITGRYLDASFEGVGSYSGRSYVVKGNKYRRYNWSSNTNDDLGSLPLFAFHLEPGYHAGIDAALTGRNTYSNYTYFFNGSDYDRYNWSTGRVDWKSTLASGFGLPLPFSSGISAAVNGYGSYAHFAYFFKGTQWIGYDWTSGWVSAAQPLSTWNLPSPFSSGFDTAIQGVGSAARYVYFTKGTQYVAYDFVTNTATGPWNMSSGWPALLGVNEAPTRRMVLYTTIDCSDGHSDATHMALKNRLQSIAQGQVSNPFVDDWWAPNLTTNMLADPHVLSIYGSGSFDEWSNYYTNPAICTTSYVPSYTHNWSYLLDGYKSLIVSSSVPMFMVCGSHQFLSWAFKNWSAVGHLKDPSSSDPQVRISDEQYTGLIPSPRWQERGVMGIAMTTSDPIFSGLASPMYVDEEHADEVIPGVYDTTKFQNIATFSMALTPIYYQYGGTSYQTRSTVQMLKYVYPSAANPNRVLYSTQFHPEADATSIALHTYTTAGYNAQVAANTTGATLIRNFLAQAQAFW